METQPRPRTARPRVLEAISALGAFTVPELCESAGLNDRQEAYYQLRRLEEAGFLEREQLAPVGRHRPLTLYRLTSDSAKRRALAQELAQYRPPPQPATSDSDLAAAALVEAARVLDEVASSVPAIEAQPPSTAVARLADVESKLEAARIDIETAGIESGGEPGQRLTSAPVARARARWRSVADQVAELKDRLERRRETQATMVDFVRAAAEAVSHAFFPRADAPGASTGLAIQTLTEDLTLPPHVDPAALEVLLDDIRADARDPLAPLFRHAWRTRDPELLRSVLELFSHLDAPWWQYNSESTRYLLRRETDTSHWLGAYKSLRQHVPSRRSVPFSVFACGAHAVTSARYRKLTRGHAVSLVSSCEIDFLGLSEPVRPTLFIDRQSTLDALDCSFLGPESSLHAYGPIANDVATWQGAPALRVVACLGMWGVQSDTDLVCIANALRDDKSLVIVQHALPVTPGEVRAQVLDIIDAEEIARSR